MVDGGLGRDWADLTARRGLDVSYDPESNRIVMQDRLSGFRQIEHTEFEDGKTVYHSHADEARCGYCKEQKLAAGREEYWWKRRSLLGRIKSCLGLRATR